MGSQPSKSTTGAERKPGARFRTSVVLKLKKAAKDSPEKPSVEAKQRTADDKTPNISGAGQTTTSQTHRTGAVAASNISSNSSPITGPGSVERKQKLSKSDSWEPIVAKIKISSDFLSVEEFMGHVEKLSKISPNSKIELSAKELRKMASAFESGKIPKAFCAALIRYEAWAKDMNAVMQWLSDGQCDQSTMKSYGKLRRWLEFMPERLKTGRVMPCSKRRCLNAGTVKKYHNNKDGTSQYFCSEACYLARNKENEDSLRKYAVWHDVDINQEDADWAMNYGEINGTGLDWHEVKEQVRKAKKKSEAIYLEAFKNTPGCDQLGTFPETHPKVANLQHVDKEIISVYQNGINNVFPDLFFICAQVAMSANGTGVAWNVKKPNRVLKKMRDKYGGRVDLVLDIFRISATFESVPDLAAALAMLLFIIPGGVLRVKNRVLAMCEGGYRDVLINKRVGSHIVEIQLHLANIHAVKKKGGHHAYKWFRRLIKEEDTYRWSTSSKGMLKRHGTFEGADGTRYSGDFATDDEGKLVFHGQGMWTGQSGDHYFGDVKFGVQHGKGTFSFANGDKYTGDFKDGGMTGRGVFVYQNGERYEGDMLEDEFHGEGKYTYEDGGTYIGKYEYGVKHGKGVSLDERGKKRFEGEYVNGEYSQGTLWEEGMRYEGAFRDGVIEGKGVMFYDNGDTHRGLWKNGRRHGYGEFFFADGKSKIVGVWKDGVNNNQQVVDL